MSDNTKAEDIEFLPVLPLRDLVMFPHMIAPLIVGRDKSLRSLDSANAQYGNKVLILAQKDHSVEDPKTTDLYRVGVICSLLQCIRLADASVKILIEGETRAKVTKFVSEDRVLFAKAKHIADEEFIYNRETEALFRLIRDQRFEQYAKLNNRITNDILESTKRITELGRFCDAVSAHLALKVDEKQAILEITDIHKKLAVLLMSLEKEIEILDTQNKVIEQVKAKVEKVHKKYFLESQIQALQSEISSIDGDAGPDEFSILEQKLSRKKLTKEAREKVDSELQKLRTMNPISSEAGIVRAYLEWFADLPWDKCATEKKDLSYAEAVLEKHHYGLSKIKERILEYLAVSLRKHSKTSVICLFLGPPGVGKTSLAKSIAESTGRPFVKISLGGVRDEAEIRGHRRTYIGAMPGRIIQSLKKAKYNNPVMLLDEIDKISSDFKGDPGSALLEVLDLEQNSKFNDNYLEVDYDLSNVMFVATANSTYGIPSPLLDRMEVIRLSGYTDDEKMQIALRYLIPKQFKEHGLKGSEIAIEPEVISSIIKYYTREAGVRELERKIAKICRKVVRKLLATGEKSITVSADLAQEYLGMPKYTYTLIEKEDLVGMVNGLAYTEFGGDVLVIESVASYGKGELKITGKLGEVMKESAYAAISYIRSKAIELGIHPTLFSKRDIHVHVPEGATPKDGPSAGITICTSIVSVLTGIPVRKDIAMTGEITLRGRVLEIGGLKEKLLAAKRSEIKTVLIPKGNEKDLEDIENEIKAGLNIVAVETVFEVFKIVLAGDLKPLDYKIIDDLDATHESKMLNKEQ